MGSVMGYNINNIMMSWACLMINQWGYNEDV
jgi:hypothetical protein